MMKMMKTKTSLKKTKNKMIMMKRSQMTKMTMMPATRHHSRQSKSQLKILTMKMRKRSRSLQ
jgi:hypothetical protein